MGSGPKVILVAGIHRSGSTWVWGAARHLLAAASQPTHAAWIEDYAQEDPAAVHLVKAHRPEEVTFAPDLILTTWRDRAASIASLIRMGWVKDEDTEIIKADARLTKLYVYWNAQSDLETRYDDILNDPAQAVRRIAQTLGLNLPDGAFGEIAQRLAQQNPPKGQSYDPTTLLHPGHRNTDQDQNALIARINRLLAARVWTH